MPSVRRPGVVGRRLTAAPGADVTFDETGKGDRRARRRVPARPRDVAPRGAHGGDQTEAARVGPCPGVWSPFRGPARPSRRPAGVGADDAVFGPRSGVTPRGRVARLGVDVRPGGRRVTGLAGVAARPGPRPDRARGRLAVGPQGDTAPPLSREEVAPGRRPAQPKGRGDSPPVTPRPVLGPGLGMADAVGPRPVVEDVGRPDMPRRPRVPETPVFGRPLAGHKT